MASTLNADNGVISGSSGLKSTADSSGVLALQTNGTTAITLDTSQNATFAAAASVTGNLTAPKHIYTSSSLGTASAGASEYNGTALYFTPAGTQRGIVPGMQYFMLNSTLPLVLTSSTILPWLGVGVTLSSNTIYAFDAIYATSKPVGGTGHQLITGFGGTATLNAINYFMTSAYDNTGFGQPNDPVIGTYFQTASLVTISSSNSGLIYYTRRMTGTVSVATGGTFIPQASQTTASSYTYTTAVGSYFLIYPIGPAGSNVNVGTWA